MKATPELINLFLQTADDLENDVFDYRWDSKIDCNLGVLAQSHRRIKGMNFGTSDLCKYQSAHSTWGEMIDRELITCQQTGIPIRGIIQELMQLGFETIDDFNNIEYLGDPNGFQLFQKILEMDSDIPFPEDIHFAKKENVINFFRAKAKQLQEQLDIENNSVLFHVKSNISQPVTVGVSL